MAKVKKKKSLLNKQTAERFGSPAGVALIFLILSCSLILSKNRFQLAKEKLTQNSNDFEAHLVLAEEFLANNQVKEAESALLLAQSRLSLTGNVLGEKTSLKLEDLWKRKHYSDKADVYRLIVSWQKIIAEKPNYRDGYLQLAFLYYQIYQNDKAKAYLQKALVIDPNYEPARKLEETLGF